jgi:hypothetical protein
MSLFPNGRGNVIEAASGKNQPQFKLDCGHFGSSGALQWETAGMDCAWLSSHEEMAFSRRAAFRPNVS